MKLIEIQDMRSQKGCGNELESDDSWSGCDFYVLVPARRRRSGERDAGTEHASQVQGTNQYILSHVDDSLTRYFLQEKYQESACNLRILSLVAI